MKYCMPLLYAMCSVCKEKRAETRAVERIVVKKIVSSEEPVRVVEMESG